MTTTAKNVQCTCQTFFFGTWGPDGSAESFEDYGTECTQTTGRVFAQGHDAKLVGFLVRAELAGEEIATVSGGMRRTFQDAVDAAASISQALAAKTEAQLIAAQKRAAKKANKPAKKAKAAAPQPTTRAAKIKVGRWTYDATINEAGHATYTTKSGQVTATSDKYTEIN
jgi:hypothetical protein